MAMGKVCNALVSHAPWLPHTRMFRSQGSCGTLLACACSLQHCRAPPMPFPRRPSRAALRGQRPPWRGWPRSSGARHRRGCRCSCCRGCCGAPGGRPDARAPEVLATARKPSGAAVRPGIHYNGASPRPARTQGQRWAATSSCTARAHRAAAATRRRAPCGSSGGVCQGAPDVGSGRASPGAPPARGARALPGGDGTAGARGARALPGGDGTAGALPVSAAAGAQPACRGRIAPASGLRGRAPAQQCSCTAGTPSSAQRGAGSSRASRGALGSGSLPLR
jgi:hypothetical protein